MIATVEGPKNIYGEGEKIKESGWLGILSAWFK